MTGTEIAAILVAVFGGIPAVSLVVGNVRKAQRESRDARDNSIRESMRAEFYKLESERTIDQMVSEIETWKGKHAETDGRLRNLLENEWPRLRTQIDDLTETNLNLSRKLGDP